MRTTPDPILAAIALYRSGYDAFQVAPEGEDSEMAEDDMIEAGSEMLSTSCSTLAGCFDLVEHLRLFIAEEAVNYAAEDGYLWSQIKAREAEMTMLLGSTMPARRHSHDNAAGAN